MSFIVITSNTVKIHIDFGVYGSSDKVPETMHVSKRAILEVMTENDVVQVTLSTGKSYYVSYEDNSSNGVFKIDSVDGISPTDNSHLELLIANLMG